MDDSERIAREYLRSLNLGKIVYEPDGNVPPDFVVDGRIAVEVRRLNQQKDLPSGDIEALDNLAIPFTKRIERYLSQLGPSLDGESWFVYVTFSRPLEPLRELQPLLEAALLSFMRTSERKRQSISVTPHLELEMMMRASKPHSSFYLLGGYEDEDSGGFTLAETTKGLAVCIPEKQRKIAPFKGRYPEWWLVLVNHIGLRLNTDDRYRLREWPPLSHDWEKVILVNPLDPTDGFEI